jgi:hypothetical protein
MSEYGEVIIEHIHYVFKGKIPAKGKKLWR